MGEGRTSPRGAWETGRGSPRPREAASSIVQAWLEDRESRGAQGQGRKATATLRSWLEARTRQAPPPLRERVLEHALAVPPPDPSRRASRPRRAGAAGSSGSTSRRPLGGARSPCRGCADHPRPVGASRRGTGAARGVCNGIAYGRSRGLSDRSALPHLLPGVDDGSRTVQQSLGVLEDLQRQGVTHLCLTPHVLTSRAGDGVPEPHDRAPSKRLPPCPLRHQAAPRRRGNAGPAPARASWPTTASSPSTAPGTSWSNSSAGHGADRGTEQ